MAKGPLPRLPRSQTLLSRTEQALREAITRGDFAGRKLPPASEIAEQLGVSRETVRLAQETLQREGLIVKYRRRGTLLEPPALKLRKAVPRSTLLGYLQAEYASREGGSEAVTTSTSGPMLHGAMREAARAGFTLVVHPAPHTEMDAVLERLGREAPLRGTIFASFGEEKLVRRTLGMGWPVVLLDHDLHLPKISTVREDAVQGARLAVEHLDSLGHRRIAYANWRLADLNPWRITGFREGLRNAKLPRRRAWELSAEITREGAELLAGTLLALEPRPTALVCFNNTLAKLVIERLRKRRIRVPEEMSVLGIGGEEVDGLSCVQADWTAMGRAAVQLLLRAIAAHGEATPEHRLFPYEIRPGATCAAPASAPGA